MSKKKERNFAYIDGANLHKGIGSLGWKIDYRRFRVWLTEKYCVERAYIFIGLIPKYKDLYTFLQEAGFTLIFKETIYDGEGKIKGNCDADLVLHAVKDVFESDLDKMVIVSSDGDYAAMVKFLNERKKLRILLSPHKKEQCSILLKRTNAPITYLDGVRAFLEIRKTEKKKEKAPGTDGTAQGSFS
jgi:uncharacterized LabA/DUF88 family protein